MITCRIHNIHANAFTCLIYFLKSNFFPQTKVKSYPHAATLLFSLITFRSKIITKTNEELVKHLGSSLAVEIWTLIIIILLSVMPSATSHVERL